jgi:hypothetical protein
MENNKSRKHNITKRIHHNRSRHKNVNNFTHDDQFTIFNKNSTQYYQKTIKQTLKQCNNIIPKENRWKYEVYLQNKFHLQILLLQHCGHCGAHVCRVCWSFWKARMQLADNQTTFTHCPVCLQCSRKLRRPPHVKCGL